MAVLDRQYVNEREVPANSGTSTHALMGKKPA